MFPEHQNSILEWFLKNSVILNTGCWKFIVAITGINYIFKYINIENSYFKVPLLRFMKGSYFGFGSPQQQVGMHARSKNTFIVLQYAFIFTLFAQWLPSDSLNDSFLQTPPLCDANLWWLVDFILPVMPDKAAFVRAVLLCVQRYRGNRYFYRSKST